MTIGMLWFDDDRQRDLASKVQRAADYYRKKFGKKPVLCYVHPETLQTSEMELVAAGVRVMPSAQVLQNHFWLGLPDD